MIIPSYEKKVDWIQSGRVVFVGYEGNKATFLFLGLSHIYRTN